MPWRQQCGSRLECETLVVDEPRFAVLDGGFEHNSQVGGIYPEACLLPTGERASAELFWLPGPFRARDVVQVAADCEFRDAAGRTAVLTDAYSEDPETGEVLLCVWIEELGETFMIAPGQLSATGARVPPERRGRVARSTAVSTDGEIRGTSTFVIIDEVHRYL